MATGLSRTLVDRAVLGRILEKPGVSLRLILTTTGRWTCSWPMTRWQIFCLQTGEKANSKKLENPLALHTVQKAAHARGWAWIQPTSTRTVGWICSSPTSIGRCTRFIAIITMKVSMTAPELRMLLTLLD